MYFRLEDIIMEEERKSIGMRIKKDVKGILIGLLFVLVLSPLTRLIRGDIQQFHSFLNFIHANIYAYVVSILLWTANANLGIWTGSKLNWTGNPRRANTISMLIIMIAGIAISIVVPYVYLKYFEKIPQERLSGLVAIYAFITLAINFIIMSFLYSDYLVKYWEKSIKANEALKRENLLAEYEALKSQVNPHFLFNSLNTLTGVVEKSQEKATEYINKLSMIYRYVLDHRNKDLIPLQEEMNFLNDFIYLSKIRYGKGLLVQNQVTVSRIMIVPMALQLLLENAIKHNVISLEEPLTVNLYTIDGYICMQNNFQPKSSIQKTNRVGLENLTKRYEYLCKKIVEIEKTDAYFEVRIPIIKEDKA